MKQLIAFNGNLEIKDCCAKPGHRVRLATLEDVACWLEEQKGIVLEGLPKYGYTRESHLDGE